jgi:hypothetical protein
MAPLAKAQNGNTYIQNKTKTIIRGTIQSLSNENTIEIAINQRKFDSGLPIKNMFESFDPTNLPFPQFTFSNGVL